MQHSHKMKKKNILLIVSVIVAFLGLLAAAYMVRKQQETRRGATGTFFSFGTAVPSEEDDGEGGTETVYKVPLSLTPDVEISAFDVSIPINCQHVKLKRVSFTGGGHFLQMMGFSPKCISSDSEKEFTRGIFRVRNMGTVTGNTEIATLVFSLKFDQGAQRVVDNHGWIASAVGPDQDTFYNLVGLMPPLNLSVAEPTLPPGVTDTPTKVHSTPSLVQCNQTCGPGGRICEDGLECVSNPLGDFVCRNPDCIEAPNCICPAPTVEPTPAACQSACTSDDDCDVYLRCMTDGWGNSRCVNPACPEKADCSCGFRSELACNGVTITGSSNDVGSSNGLILVRKGAMVTITIKDMYDGAGDLKGVGVRYKPAGMQGCASSSDYLIEKVFTPRPADRQDSTLTWDTGVDDNLQVGEQYYVFGVPFNSNFGCSGDPAAGEPNSYCSARGGACTNCRTRIKIVDEIIIAPTATNTPPAPGTCTRGGDGDINCDGNINIYDMTLLLEAWVYSIRNNDAVPTPRSGYASADLNSDGVVDVSDAQVLIDHWDVIGGN